MEIRVEQTADWEAIRRVNIAAFGRVNEADLVDRLRHGDYFSFVAVEAGQVVGHIFFSPVSVEVGSPLLPVYGLAPLAVLPDRQKQGIGSLLVRHSLQQLAEAGCGAAVVLGDPDYYDRFQFRAAKARNLACEYEVPDEAFRVIELQEGALQGCQGMIRYQPEFADL